MDRPSERRSSAASLGKPGSLAAQRRLSGLSNAAAAPPATEKPYLAERKVSAAVSNRVSQKAELMQYLAGHASTVGRMLGSIPKQNPTNANPVSDSFASTAPAALGYMGHNPAEPPGRLSSTSAASAVSAAAAGARKSSVSAYLTGQQDLLTTITEGVPYASGVASMLGGTAGTVSPVGGPAGRCSTASCCSSILSTGTAASSTAAAAAGGGCVNSRHSAVKEALNARMSTAAATSNTSPRFHDESLGLRQSLMAEGRARRASAVAVLPAAAGTPATGAGRNRSSPIRNSARSSQFYPTDPMPVVSDQGINTGGFSPSGSTGNTGSLLCPQVVGYGQYNSTNSTAAGGTTAAEAAWLDAYGPGASNQAQSGGSAYRTSDAAAGSSGSSSSSSSDGSSSDTGDASDTEATGSESEWVIGARVRGWGQRASVVKAARKSTIAAAAGGGSGRMSVRGSIAAKRASVKAAAVAAARRASDGKRHSSATAAATAAAAAAAAASAVARQSVIQKQKGVRKMSLNRWSSSNNRSGKGPRGADSSNSTASSSNSGSSSSSTSRRGSNSSSSSDGAKCIAQVRRSMRTGQTGIYRRSSSSFKMPNLANQRRSSLTAGRTSSIRNAARRYAAPRSSIAAQRCRFKSFRHTTSSASSGSSDGSSGSSGSSDTSRRVSQVLSRRSSSAAALARGPRASKAVTLQRAQAKRRLLALSMLQKVGRRLQANTSHSSSNGSSGSSDGSRRASSSSNSSNENYGWLPSVTSAAGTAASRQASLAAAGAAAKRASIARASLARRSLISSRRSFGSGTTRKSSFGRRSSSGAAVLYSPGQYGMGAARLSAASVARRSLTDALDTMLNPSDKPSHRLSTTDHDAEAVVLGRDGGRCNVTTGTRASLGREVYRRTSSSSSSSGGRRSFKRRFSSSSSDKRRESRIQAAAAAARRSVRSPSVAAVNAAGSQSVAQTVDMGRSSRAPSVMVRPGRKTWVQVYEAAIGEV